MRNRLEVADVFRDGQSRFVAQYGYTLRPEQRQVLRAIIRCRTAELGGHVQRCNDCGYQRIQYNSCRNRHCPKCQATARAAWLEARQAELLPIPYFHVVFTLPEEIRPLALQNKRVVYGILFRAAAETLQEVAANPKHLGAEIGLLAVLHTWGQNLMHHPHVHCVVTGGGLAPGRSRWVPCQRSRRRKNLFFVPVRILSRVFRGKFIDFLKRTYYEDRPSRRPEAKLHIGVDDETLACALKRRGRDGVAEDVVGPCDLGSRRHRQHAGDHLDIPALAWAEHQPVWPEIDGAPVSIRGPMMDSEWEHLPVLNRNGLSDGETRHAPSLGASVCNLNRPRTLSPG
jgi:hypothetical protein